MSKPHAPTQILQGLPRLWTHPQWLHSEACRVKSACKPIGASVMSGCGPELARCGDGEPRFAVPPQGTKASRSMAHGAGMSKRSIEACVLRQGEEQNVLDDHLDSILEPWPRLFHSAPAQAAARVGSRYRGLACSSPYLLKRSTNCQTRICLRRMPPAGLSTFAHLALLPRRFGA